MATLIEQRIGDVQIALYADDPPEIETIEAEGLNYTSSTSLPDLPSLISGIAAALSDKLESLSDKLKPDEVVMDVSIGLSEKLNMWVIGGKGEQKLSLKLTWRRS